MIGCYNYGVSSGQKNQLIEQTSEDAGSWPSVILL